MPGEGPWWSYSSAFAVAVAARAFAGSVGVDLPTFTA
jgi:hypothetical protein